MLLDDDGDVQRGEAWDLVQEEALEEEDTEAQENEALSDPGLAVVEVDVSPPLNIIRQEEALPLLLMLLKMQRIR
ncbi:hypothetical protein AMTR_s00144p00080610 [Amborella trichopoda]|uniref:Uncharacterized protein n=1 Tax=Amborella trichopoda TaxID=13333 RepID=W1P6Y7_AMBTC|nr:hypothetical protein AMTR_s00144p00080610 [Amborella trichopoda]